MPTKAPYECSECGKGCYSATALHRHCVNVCNFSETRLCDEQIHDRAARELLNKKPQVMGDEEAFGTQPGKDKQHFYCQYCDDNFLKRNLVKHMCSVHCEDKECVKDWQGAKDVQRMKDGLPPLMEMCYEHFFDEIISENAESEDVPMSGCEDQDSDEGVPSEHDVQLPGDAAENITTLALIKDSPDTSRPTTSLNLPDRLQFRQKLEIEMRNLYFRIAAKSTIHPAIKAREVAEIETKQLEDKVLDMIHELFDYGMQESEVEEFLDDAPGYDHSFYMIYRQWVSAVSRVRELHEHQYTSRSEHVYTFETPEKQQYALNRNARRQQQSQQRATNAASSSNRVLFATDEDRQNVLRETTEFQLQVYDRIAKKAFENDDTETFNNCFNKAIALRQDLDDNGVELHQPTPRSAASSSSFLELLSTACHDAVAKALPKEKTIPEPRIAIKDYWKNQWSRPQEWAQKERVRDCPLTDKVEFWLDGFEHYQTAKLRLSVRDTVKPNMRHMRRLLSILDIRFPSGLDDEYLKTCQWAIGFCSALTQGDLLEDIFCLAVLHPDFSWSHKCLSTLKHLVEYARLNARERKLTAQQENIETLEVRFESLQKVFTDAKLDQTSKRLEKDGDRIEDMPSTEEQIAACRQAMYDMVWLHTYTQGETKLTKGQMASAQTIQQGVLYLLSKAGRSGEWSKMKMADAIAQLVEKNKDYIVATSKEHKTGTKRGTLVKVFPECVQMMFKFYFDLPGMADEECIFSPKDTMANRMTKFDMMYFGRKCFYSANLVRKMRANNRKVHATTAARAIGAWEDGHALATEEDNYIAMSSARKAELARINLELECPHVDFPTDEEMEFMRPMYFLRPRKDDGGISFVAKFGDVSHALEKAEEERAEESHAEMDVDDDDVLASDASNDGQDTAKRESDNVHAEDDGEVHSVENDLQNRDVEMDIGDDTELVDDVPNAGHDAARHDAEKVDDGDDNEFESVEKDLKQLIDTAIDNNTWEQVIAEAETSDTPDVTHVRRFEYNKTTGKFAKDDVAAPNLIQHKPPPSYRQQTLAEFTSPTTSANERQIIDNEAIDRHTIVARGVDFADMEKKFLVKELRDYQGDGNTCPEKEDIRAMVSKGHKSGKLIGASFDNAYIERVRNFFRQFKKQFDLAAKRYEDQRASSSTNAD